MPDSELGNAIVRSTIGSYSFFASQQLEKLDQTTRREKWSGWFQKIKKHFWSLKTLLASEEPTI